VHLSSTLLSLHPFVDNSFFAAARANVSLLYASRAPPDHGAPHGRRFALQRLFVALWTGLTFPHIVFSLLLALLFFLILGLGLFTFTSFFSFFSFDSGFFCLPLSQDEFSLSVFQLMDILRFRQIFAAAPTIAPVEYDAEHAAGYLEHPAAAFKYFTHAGECMSSTVFRAALPAPPSRPQRFPHQTETMSEGSLFSSSVCLRMECHTA
jgi:hypothetical protein